MAGNNCQIDAERIDKTDHVTDKMQKRVLLDGVGPVRSAVAAHVGCDRTEPCGRQCRKLMPPRVPGFRKAVAQHDQGSFALLGDVQVNAVRFDHAMRDGAGHRRLPG
jgi:hypothetical protein